MLKQYVIRVALFTLIVLTVAACGGGDDDSTPQPTQPPPTDFPTYAFVQPTEAPAIATAAAERNATATAQAESGEVALDPVMVERGLGRYEALECGSCHGENGEGTDDGSSLLEYTADEATFTDFMRTGGEMGDDHRYPAERLSNSGVRNLYQYLLSLTQE